MQAKISAGTDCLRFLRVTGENLPAPAGNSHEVFIVRVRADFFKPRDVSFYPSPNTLTKVTICFLWSQCWTFQIWFCSKSVEVFFAGSSNQYPKKPLAEKVFTTIKVIGNWLLSLKSKEEKTIKRILSASFLLHCIDGNRCFRYWNEFLSAVFQVLGWSFLVLHFYGNVCNWIPKVIWPRMDWFWDFLLENGFFRWLHIYMEWNLQEMLNCYSFLTTSNFFNV